MEKVQAVVAQSTLRRQKCQKHISVETLSRLEMSKKCTLLWREHLLKPKCHNHIAFGPLLGVQTSFLVAGAKDPASLPTCGFLYSRHELDAWASVAASKQGQAWVI